MPTWRLGDGQGLLVSAIDPHRARTEEHCPTLLAWSVCDIKAILLQKGSTCSSIP